MIVPDKSTIVDSLNSAIESVVAVGVLDDFVDAFIDTLLDIWGDAAAVDDALTRTSSNGAMLEALAGALGVLKLPPTRATATVICTGDPGTPIPAGSVVSTVKDYPAPETTFVSGVQIGDVIFGLLDQTQSDLEFVTDEDVELEIVRSVVPESDDDLVVGELFTIDSSNGRGFVFQCTSAGDLGATNSIAFLSAIPGDDLTADGSAVMRTVGRGIAAASVGVTSAESSRETVPSGKFVELDGQNEDDDPLDVFVGICQIGTPIAGWQNVLNPETGSPGRLQEVDDELLSRMLLDVAHDAPNQTGRASTTPSSDPVRGVESTLRRIDGVIDAIVWDAVGNMFAVVLGGSDSDVAVVLHDMLPLGIRTAYSGNGTLVTQNVKRLDGHSRLMVFERPLVVPVSVEAIIVVDESRFAGEAAAIEAIESLTLTRHERPVGERLQLGQNATAIKIVCELRELAGVTNAQVFVNGGQSVAVGEHEYAEIEVTELGIIT
jgi:hypothetical protein